MSYPVVYAYEDINKYLSETLKVSPERLLRCDQTLESRKKERAHTEIVGFLGVKIYD